MLEHNLVNCHIILPCDCNVHKDIFILVNRIPLAIEEGSGIPTASPIPFSVILLQLSPQCCQTRMPMMGFQFLCRSPKNLSSHESLS